MKQFLRGCITIIISFIIIAVVNLILNYFF